MHIGVTPNEQSAIPSERKRTKALFLAAVFAVLVATLWPFDFFAQNGVTWLHGTRGLSFENHGVVVSNGYVKPAEGQGTDSYSLEFLVQPANWNAAPILAFYNGRPACFIVGQRGEHLIVTHDAAIQSDTPQRIDFYADHIFRPGKLALVTISSGPNGTTVYLDGETASSFPRFKLSRSDLSGQIVLGTSPTMYEPWVGELQGLAIYSKELTAQDAFRHYREWTDPSGVHESDGVIARYRFAETEGREVRDDVASGPGLEIPAVFSVPHKAMLRSLTREFHPNRKYAKDVLENIGGFVPLGLIACAYFSWTRSHWKAIVSSTIACGSLSLVIEVLQYYIPRRFSGTTDILTNTLGAAVGAALIQADVVRRALKDINLIRE